MNNCTFAENFTYTSGTIFIADSKCNLNNCDIYNNVSKGNAAGIICCENYGSGNGKFKPRLFVNNSKFTNNIAEHHGGAIALFESIATIKNTIFKMNKAKDFIGGAIMADECTLILTKTKFYGNSAGLGGAVYSGVHNNPADWMKLNITNCTFRANKGVNGGALTVGKIPTIIRNTEFVENVGEIGGAAFFSEYVELSIEKCKFLRNRAKEGGGIAAECSILYDCVISDTEFINNRAKDVGGALMTWTKEDSIQFDNCTFTNNQPNDTKFSR
ncbi:MAG: hypothetical protein K8S87_08460 [Planctomycetes bacterium]|nr:hypothetical protein [Planctomycetota bacterium]